MIKLTYVVSGRSFFKKNLGRKIYSVISVFEKNINLFTVLGGDLLKIDNSNKTNKNSTGFVTSKYSFFVNSISELRDIIHDIKLYLHLVKSNRKVDIVWERSSRLHFLTLLYARRNNAIYVHEWIDNLLTLYNFSAFKWIGRLVENVKLNKSDFIVVPNGVIKNDLIKKGVDGNKIKVAFNGVDVDLFRPKPKEDEVFRILYIGSYAFYHDIFTLIDAIYHIQSNFPDYKIHFDFYGSGMHEEGAKKKVEEYNLLNTMFHGRIHMNEVPATINQSSLCVLPGTTEIICPIKIMEFMSCGKATILPNYDCNKEVVDDGINGILFTPFDHVDLAEKIIKAYDSKIDISRIGANARLKAEKEFTWEATWGKVLKEIMKERGLDVS